MKKLLLAAGLLLCLAFSAAAQEEIKTGYNFGPVPAIAFDADKGFQLGALVNIYNFGDGSSYPNYKSMTYLEASFFSKGSKLFTVYYDNMVLIPGVRVSACLTAALDKAMDFYGFNGYQSYYDVQRINDKSLPYYNPFYRVDRVQILGNVDFTGNITDNLQWEAGYHPSYFREGAIDRASINKGKEGNDVYQEQSTLYEDYVNWGLIGASEAAGGFSSTVRLGLQYDTRDKEGAPTRGIWAEGHLSLAPSWLGTKNPYYRYSLTMRQYFPLIDNDVLTACYRVNYEGSFGKNDPYYVLPYMTRMGLSFDRDGMGGYDTVRGMLRDRVMGLDMATWTAELRWRFVKFVLWKQNIGFGLTAFTDGAMVTRGRSMAFSGDEGYRSAYELYMASGQEKDVPHITAGAGLRFIMNENFIIAFEYGAPITAFGGGALAGQDGTGAFYINTGYLF